MKKISCWAHSHKWIARILIVISFILLNVLGICAGQLLWKIGINLSVPLLLIITAIYLAAFLGYPGKRGIANYTWQKTCDLLLAGSVFGMFVYMGNNTHLLFTATRFNSAYANTSSVPGDSTKRNYKSIKEFSASLKDSKGDFLKWKERKKLLKSQVKEIRRDNNLSTGVKILLIILSVAAALGLLYLVAALSCSLSCSGSDGLAALVLSGGLLLTIVLLIVLIRIILGIKKKKKRDNKKENKVQLEN